jgi:hypothetical protein
VHDRTNELDELWKQLRLAKVRDRRVSDDDRGFRDVDGSRVSASLQWERP